MKKKAEGNVSAVQGRGGRAAIETAINIETLYPDKTVEEKIERVSRAGFTAIEFWRWDNKDIDSLHDACRKHGVKVQAFGGTGDYSLCDRFHRSECLEHVRRSIEAAEKLDCSNLILFPNHFTAAGCADFTRRDSHTSGVASITAALCEMVPMLEEHGITALLEPLCNVGADSGMTVTDTAEGADIVRAVGSEHVRLLCDVYHMQVMHGNLQQNILSNVDIVPYIHIADAPDRHEPGTGEINFDYLMKAVKTGGFTGTVCFEYFPSGETESSFPAVQGLLELLK